MTNESIASVEVITNMVAAQSIAEGERVHGVPAPVIAPSLLARDLAQASWPPARMDRPAENAKVRIIRGRCGGRKNPQQRRGIFLI